LQFKGHIVTEPLPISPTAVYTSAQACAVLGIGEKKLASLVADGLVRPMRFTRTLLFWGGQLIAFCESESRADQ
jgi:hypothetical protein